MKTGAKQKDHCPIRFVHAKLKGYQPSAKTRYSVKGFVGRQSMVKVITDVPPCADVLAMDSVGPPIQR